MLLRYVFISMVFHLFFKGKFHLPVKSSQVAHFISLKKKPHNLSLDLLCICHPSTVMMRSLTTRTINEVPWSSKILWFYFLENLLIESQCLYRGTWRHYPQKTAVHFNSNHRVIGSCWISNWKAAHVFCRSILIA